MKNENKIGGLAFLPLIVFLVLYVGCGLAFTFAGVESPFGKLPRHVALFAGIATALLLVPSIKLDEKVKVLTENMGNSGVMTIVLIYLLAGGFQGGAAGMGGKTSVVNFCLQFIPPSLLIPGIFLICCFVSTSIGTSMGTIAAMAPVAVGVASGAGLNLAMTGAAVIGGSYFGDNLSMISDTTISAAEGCGSEMKDKFRMNFFIALPAAIITLVIYAVTGGVSQGAIEVGPYDIIQILPYFVVLIAALCGVPVVFVLFVGILSTGVIGLAQGTLGFFDWAQAVGGGMSDMFSISIVAILISGIIGLVRLYGGVEWMVDTITKKIKDRKGAEYGVSLLSGILSAALINNTIAIIITSPIAKEIGSLYKIAPKRMASLIDIFACAFISLVPHDGGMLMITELSGSSPIEVLKYQYYMYILIIVTCITIHTGLLRTAEEKETQG